MKKDIKNISSKIIKILTILNICILLGMALFCFQNSDLNIDGICDECCIYTEEIFTFSKIVLVLQAIVVIAMFRQSRKSEERSKYGFVSGLAWIGIFLALIQLGAFYINPGASAHGRKIKAIEMMDMQIEVAMITSLVLVVANIILLVSAKMFIHQSDKEYINELNSNHILSNYNE